ncbi:MAG: hypothetical protein B6U97_00030 [Candidatus Altiarchaeales archaeon ex4484_96]|nr:MAG: hypothetical protein B6U97_00030 [Candidatus Altiarchaeales archaeon ex4484_96]
MDSEIGILLGESAPCNINQLLESIFWKEKKLAPKANKLLKHIREWSRTQKPYTTDEWSRYCAKNNISQSSYHNMLKRLRKAKMIEKRYNKHNKKHELHLTDGFSELMFKQGNLWESFLRE